MPRVPREPLVFEATALPTKSVTVPFAKLNQKRVSVIGPSYNLYNLGKYNLKMRQLKWYFYQNHYFQS